VNDTGRKKTKVNSDFTEIRFFIQLYELKNTFVTPLHLLFLFTNKRAVLSYVQTDQLSSQFPA